MTTPFPFEWFLDLFGDVDDGRLDRIVPGGAAKGFAPYRPYAKTQLHYGRILRLYQELHDADALPVGPRSVGYSLKERYVGEYVKERRRGAAGFDFAQVGEVIKRAAQARTLPWSWIADASAVTFLDRVWPDRVGFLRDAHDLYARDRTEGQPVVVEVCSEARETAGLIRRLCAERGVTAYSGGGSAGPGLAYKVAARAVGRAVGRGQSTLIIGVCDFDQPGIRNVLRPHVEHVAAFVYKVDPRNDRVLADKDADGRLLAVAQTGATVSFRHLALTPEMALDLVETESDRSAVSAYVDSGAGLWDRDLGLLDGVQKVELEALDPVRLRDLVAGALDDVLDLDRLRRVVEEEAAERADLKARLGRVADDLGGGAR